MKSDQAGNRPDAGYWIRALGLNKHVEGGSFSEFYRSPGLIPSASLSGTFGDLSGRVNGDRSFSTSIYFLLEKGQFSAFHRIASDEVWHFYYGDPLLIYEIDRHGALKPHLLGSDPENGEAFQTVVQAGNWFASVPAPGSEYSLVGCTVAPGFDFADFALADREKLSAIYPQHSTLIRSLTR